jgi:hypothetical protein
MLTDDKQTSPATALLTNRLIPFSFMVITPHFPDINIDE